VIPTTVIIDMVGIVKTLKGSIGNRRNEIPTSYRYGMCSTTIES